MDVWFLIREMGDWDECFGTDIWNLRVTRDLDPRAYLPKRDKWHEPLSFSSRYIAIDTGPPDARYGASLPLNWEIL